MERRWLESKPASRRRRGRSSSGLSSSFSPPPQLSTTNDEMNKAFNPAKLFPLPFQLQEASPTASTSRLSPSPPKKRRVEELRGRKAASPWATMTSR